jgi:hypothetical protein
VVAGSALHSTPSPAATVNKTPKIALGSCTPAASTARRMARPLRGPSALRGLQALAERLPPRRPGCFRATNHVHEKLQQHRTLCWTASLGGSNQRPWQTRTRMSLRPASLLCTSLHRGHSLEPSRPYPNYTQPLPVPLLLLTALLRFACDVDIGQSRSLLPRTSHIRFTVRIRLRPVAISNVQRLTPCRRVRASTTNNKILTRLQRALPRPVTVACQYRTRHYIAV